MLIENYLNFCIFLSVRHLERGRSNSLFPERSFCWWGYCKGNRISMAHDHYWNNWYSFCSSLLFSSKSTCQGRKNGKKILGRSQVFLDHFSMVFWIVSSWLNYKICFCSFWTEFPKHKWSKFLLSLYHMDHRFFYCIKHFVCKCEEWNDFILMLAVCVALLSTRHGVVQCNFLQFLKILNIIFFCLLCRVLRLAIFGAVCFSPELYSFH